jgi:hypothetical protein
MLVSFGKHRYYKGKGKVVPMVFSFNLAARHEGLLVSGDIAPSIL